MGIAVRQVAAEMSGLIYPPKEKSYSADIEEPEIEYPESDGEPMGETGSHVRASLHLYGALRQFYLNKTDVYVAADMFMYYEKGNPKACKAPDVMVIKGVPNNYERRTFKLWEEKSGPCVIFEISSQSTMIEDLVTKSFVYASLGVHEYYLFDPLREFLKEGLKGFRLADREFIPILPDNRGRLYSNELVLNLTPEDEILRILDPLTGAPIPSYTEALMLVEEERQRVEEERQRAEEERQRAEEERQRAEQEKQSAEQEKQRAEQEKQRAEKLVSLKVVYTFMGSAEPKV